MSDWQVGDLALCVLGGFISGGNRPPFPDAGAVYTVTGVRIFYDGDCFLYCKGAPNNLGLDGFDWGPLWHVSRFRKIRPDEHEACEEEFVTLINRTKRKLLDDQEQRHSGVTERSRLWDRAWEALSQRDLSAFDQTMKQFWKLGERA